MCVITTVFNMLLFIDNFRMFLPEKNFLFAMHNSFFKWPRKVQAIVGKDKFSGLVLRFLPEMLLAKLRDQLLGSFWMPMVLGDKLCVGQRLKVSKG